MHIDYQNVAESALMKIAKTVGFTEDISLLEGKMGVAIILFHGSRYFSSKELRKVSEFLIDDIIEESDKLLHLSNQRSSDIFWAFNYLSYYGFIDIGKNFFNEVDEILFSDIKDYMDIDVVNYFFLGNYILSGQRTSTETNLYISKAKEYISNVINIINLNRIFFVHNFDLLAPFWYVMLKWKETGFIKEVYSKKLEEVLLFFNNEINELSNNTSINPSYQFFSRFNGIELKRIVVDKGTTISDINSIYLNKLLYSDYTIPSNNQVKQILSTIVSGGNILKELESLVSYQNIGIKGYFSGFIWVLLNFIQNSN